MKLQMILGILALLAPAMASAGDKVLNGGDACERRFQEVSTDIKTWIEKGGAKALDLGTGLTLSQYEAGILGKIQAANIACVGGKLRVGAAEKVCLNESDASGHARITCQREAYLNLSPNEQYRLTHHEYAGLAGFEVNEGESSNYRLSDQITGYLDSYVTKRLTVKTDLTAAEAIDRNFKDFYGIYEVKGCNVTSDVPEVERLVDFCAMPIIKIARGGGLSRKEDASLQLIPVVNTSPKNLGDVMLTYSYCQLSPGSSSCSPRQGENKGIPPTTRVFYTTTFQKLGGTTFFDLSIEDTRNGKTTYQKISYVLKPYNGPLPEQKK